MALYLPHQHIVFEVVDDPCSSAIDPHAFPGLTVIPVTSRELMNPELLAFIASRVRRSAEHRREDRSLAREGL